MASRISQDGADGHGIGPCGVIAPAIGEAHRALGHGHLHAGRERQHIDDNHHITDGGQDGDPMRSPLTTDIEFLLVECHDALFSLFKSTGGLRLPNAQAHLLPEAVASGTPSPLMPSQVALPKDSSCWAATVSVVLYCSWTHLIMPGVA